MEKLLNLLKHTTVDEKVINLLEKLNNKFELKLIGNTNAIELGYFNTILSSSFLDNFDYKLMNKFELIYNKKKFILFINKGSDILQIVNKTIEFVKVNSVDHDIVTLFTLLIQSDITLLNAYFKIGRIDIKIELMKEKYSDTMNIGEMSIDERKKYIDDIKLIERLETDYGITLNTVENPPLELSNAEILFADIPELKSIYLGMAEFDVMSNKYVLFRNGLPIILSYSEIKNLFNN